MHPFGGSTASNDLVNVMCFHSSFLGSPGVWQSNISSPKGTSSTNDSPMQFPLRELQAPQFPLEHYSNCSKANLGITKTLTIVS